MHADVIILGSGIEAHILALLFARRSVRTLALPGLEPAGPSSLILVQKSALAQLKPAYPPKEAIVLDGIGLQLWSPSERHAATAPQLPFLLVDAGLWQADLERQGMATRNLRIVRGHPAVKVKLRDRRVEGVFVPSGDTVDARLVIDCGDQARPPGSLTADLLPFPDLARFFAPAASERRDVGSAASAWPLGTCLCRLVQQKLLLWRFRYSLTEVEVGAVVRPGSTLQPSRIIEKTFLDAGLSQTPVLASRQYPAWLGPPLPIASHPGFLALSLAAGHAHPLLPFEVSLPVACAGTAFATAWLALQEGDLSAGALWTFSRAVARQHTPGQGFGWSLLARLSAMTEANVESCFSLGLLSDYLLTCLVACREPEASALPSTAAALLKGLHRTPVVLAWRKALTDSLRLARSLADVPHDYSLAAAAAWSSRILSRI